MSFWHIHISAYDVQIMQCTHHFSAVYVGYIFRHDGEFSQGLYGWFSIFGSSFESCLFNIAKVLKQCVETNLVLRWEKRHFMIREGIILRCIVSKRGIEVDKSKVDLILKLPHPSSIKQIRFFWGHADFYRRFIKDFSKSLSPCAIF